VNVSAILVVVALGLKGSYTIVPGILLAATTAFIVGNELKPVRAF
jgi:hypothetical protein